MSPTRLYIPPRTRLETVWRTDTSFQVWTACADRNAPFERMLGTYLSLDNSNGSAQRVTLRPDNSIEILEVMPCFT